MQDVSICVILGCLSRRWRNDMKFLTLGADHTKEDKADAEGEDDTPW